MSLGPVEFGGFQLDPDNRQLRRGDEIVDLGSRYFDALVLLVRSQGELVTKDQFMASVWNGVPVTDEALTQAIRTLRRALSDTASSPEFIETVPKHGYRFVATVSAAGKPAKTLDRQVQEVIPPSALHTTLAGTFGAAAAGAVIGLLYGFAEAGQVSGGALSLLLVITLVAALCAGIAGAGISSGVALARWTGSARWFWQPLGGALGGLTIGAAANILGEDAFRLLFGHPVNDFSGALEGLIMGGAVGLSLHLAARRRWSALGVSLLLGLGGGIAVVLLDGRMMAGSLDELARAFPSSQIRFTWTSTLLGETGFGAASRLITGGFEGALFSSGMVLAFYRASSRPKPQ